MHTLAENCKPLSLFKPQSITATTEATGVDVEQYNDDAMIVLDSGAIAGTTETNIVTIETSVIGDFTDKVTALTFGTLTGSAGDNLIAAGKVALAGIKKIRAVITKSSTGAALFSVIALVKPTTGGASVNSVTPA